MKLSSSLHRRLHWLNLPTALLLTLLQRTPAVRVVAAVEELVVSSPLGAVLKSFAATAASLGAMHSLVGATPLVPSSGTATDLTVTVGTPVSVAYGVTGTQTPAMSWTVAGAFPPGLNFSGLTTTGTVDTGTLLMTGTPTTAGVYALTFTVWEAAGGTQISANGSLIYSYTITVTGGSATAPAFSTQPSSQSVTAGAGVTFTVAASGSPAPTIQWKKDGTSLPGATSPTLTLSNVQAADAGTYTAVATNSAGTATSSGAVLTVAAAPVAPVFTTQPSSQAVTVGASVTFTAVVSGTPAPTVQWQKGATPIAGATSPTLSLTNVQAADAATYTVVATNSAGTATSSGAVLSVSAAALAPAFATSPASQAVTAGGTATFTLAVTGSPTPTIQWRKDGVNLPGETGLTLTLTNVQDADAATYTAVATNVAGTATSTGAVLTVPAAAPVIETEPQGHTVAAGSSVVLGVAVSGGHVSYQWRKDGAPLSGATSSQLLLSQAQAGDAGSSTVTATNSAGTVTSRAAVLAVVATGDPGRLINLSVRTGAGTGDSTLIVGVVVGGAGTSGAKPLLIRAVGPTLASYGVAGTLTDPNLDFIPQGSATPAATDDNWDGDAQISSVANALGAFPMVSPTSKDAALSLTPASGVYSVKVSGIGGTTGITLAEIYDASGLAFTSSTPRLINVSARAQVGTGDGVLIAGFVIGGTTSRTVLIRAVGPTLGSYGVGGALADPRIDLIQTVGGNSVEVAHNDNWGGNAQVSIVGGNVGAFALSGPASQDAAILVTLQPGVYSAKTSGTSGTTGVALIEVYEIP